MTRTIVKRSTAYWLCSSFLLVLAILSSCSKDADLLILRFIQPSNFPAPVYDLSKNPISNDKFILGRTLFYDPILSRNNTISCGNCHQQEGAFCHIDHNVSHGIDDKVGTRNSPALQNLAFYKSFMWDGGIFDLDLQPIAPIENHVEMDEKLETVIPKLQASSKYRSLFKKAYGSETVNTVGLLKALSQFMLLMVSADSKYDKYVRGEAGGTFTDDEKEGLTLFNAKCRSCHSTDLFTDQNFRNNGLKPSAVNDSGRYKITLHPDDMYKFKVPSLRNVALTAPYMHDGRFKTLEQVLDHYRTGVVVSTTLDPLLNNGSLPGITITDLEKQKIILFLKTLTDENFTKDKRFAEQ